MTTNATLKFELRVMDPDEPLGWEVTCDSGDYIASWRGEEWGDMLEQVRELNALVQKQASMLYQARMLGYSPDQKVTD